MSIYLTKARHPTAGINTDIGSYDVHSVAFSPNYTSDKAMIAVVSNDTEIVVRSRLADNGWGQIIGDAYIPGLIPLSATIAFPADYQLMHGFFFALDTGINRGDVYRVTPAFTPLPSTITPLGIGNDDFSAGY